MDAADGTTASTSTTTGIEATLDGSVGRIVLDRPRSLNALTLPMVEQLEQVLLAWAREPLRAIVISSSSERAFCAGGDIRQVRQNTLDGEGAASLRFFATEYRVNHLLAASPAPVVALVDGVCMGGGLGLSVHGAFRVVGDAAVLAMPETSIGFFPDVGATHFLPRLPGELGTYLGLTGARVSAADAVGVGLATHHVRSADLAALGERLVTADLPVELVLAEAATRPGDSGLLSRRAEIDRTFDADSVDAILEALRAEGTPWAEDTIGVLESVSRQSLDLTLDLLRRGADLSLRACLDLELRAAEGATQTPDFVEGVRAMQVDKDRAPRWGASRYRGIAAEGAVEWSREV